jgi:cell fate regulator YaaT (PSP1 superfamily)
VPNVVSVVFRDGGKVYQFDCGRFELVVCDSVVVDTARGTDFGRVVKAPEEVAAADLPQGLKKVIRKATTADNEAVAGHKRLETDSKRACAELVSEMGLAMKVVAAEVSFDGTKTLISFVAEDRIDFRQLVGKLNDRLKRRVELKQINARDEARIVGGYGPCGRRLCCSLFAGDQEPVSIRIAKDQNLPLNPAKISGCCGRLMCCLKYEHKVYQMFKQRAPKKGTTIRTPAGDGRVVDLLAANDSVTVDLGEGRTMTFKLAELDPVGKDEDHG